MHEQGPINRGISGPSSTVYQGQEVSVDGMSLSGPDLGLLIDEEFLMNVAGWA